MTELSVRLLGVPRIEAGGEPVRTDTRKAIALLAYLAVSARPQSRGSLATLFWPENDEAKARGALRRTLSVLRRALGDGSIDANRETIEFDPRAATVDVIEFRRAVRAGRLTDAISLYGGDFLAGFAIRDSAAFDEWQTAQAEALRAEYAGALAQLANDAETAGDLAAAIGHWRRHLELDPLQEPVHRELIRLYARTGDRAAALRQYGQCARLLDTELGVSPLPETRTLSDAIRRGVLPAEEKPLAVATAEAVGDVHTLHGDYGRAIESYHAAMGKASPAAKATIEHKLAAVYHRRGDWSQAERHYEAARDASATAAERARIVANWSLAAPRAGARPRSDRLASEALILAERCGDKGALAQAHNILGILAGGSGDLAKSRTHLRTSVALADELGDPGAQVAALNNLALAYRRSGDLDRARELTERALARSAELGDRHRIAALHNNLADILREQHADSEAMRHLRRAVTLFAEIGESSISEPEVWKLVEW